MPYGRFMNYNNPNIYLYGSMRIYSQYSSISSHESWINEARIIFIYQFIIRIENKFLQISSHKFQSNFFFFCLKPKFQSNLNINLKVTLNEGNVVHISPSPFYDNWNIFHLMVRSFGWYISCTIFNHNFIKIKIKYFYN